MKRILLIFVVLLTLGFNAKGQDMFSFENEDELTADAKELQKGLKYSSLKYMYDYKDYDMLIEDPYYSLPWMGIASAFIPGLGQVIEGEVVRGLLQFVGAEILFIAGQTTLSKAQINKDENSMLLGAGMCLGALAIDIISIVESVRIAKVKNMYYNDLKKVAFDVKLTPYFNVAQTGTNTTAPVTGLSLNISF